MRTRDLSGLGWMVLLAVAVLVACGAPSGFSIRAEDVWARPAISIEESGGSAPGSMGVQGTGAVFMRLINDGAESDRLVGGQTDVAEAVEIHQTVMEGDVMKMQMLADGLEVPANDEVLLKPGGYHIMLVGLQRDLNVGDTFSLELQFEKSGTLTIEAEVREP